MLNSYAYFDSLSIISRLRDSIGNVTVIEVHLFSYLACLLSLYKGREISEWGYDFAITEYAYPYSGDLDDSIKFLHSKGMIVIDGQTLRLLEPGHRIYSQLKSLQTNSERELFIEGACASALALPVGVIRDVLLQDADRNAITLNQSRLLLTDTSLEILHRQFSALSETIGIDASNLMVPAVVWLTYLAKIRELHIAE